jgi:hypothetical protein
MLLAEGYEQCSNCKMRFVKGQPMLCGPDGGDYYCTPDCHREGMTKLGLEDPIPSEEEDE